LAEAAAVPPTAVDWEAVRQQALQVNGRTCECCVCLTHMAWQDSGECTLLSCAHVLHTACLETYHSVASAKGAQRRCPMCRASYSYLNASFLGNLNG
jgi:hypothetical protein